MTTNTTTVMVHETCDECGGDREREWLERLVGKGSPVPQGWKTVRVRGSWKTIRARTRWTIMGSGGTLQDEESTGDGCPYNWGSHGCGDQTGHRDRHACSCGSTIDDQGVDDHGFRWDVWGVGLR